MDGQNFENENNVTVDRYYRNRSKFYSRTRTGDTCSRTACKQLSRLYY